MKGYPWFKFYADAHLADPVIQQLPAAVFKAYINLMAYAWIQPNRGQIEAKIAPIARQIHSKHEHLIRLTQLGLLDGLDDTNNDPYFYLPKNRRKRDEPIVLVEAHQGPIWYLPRMVTDVYIEGQRGGPRRNDNLKRATIRSMGTNHSSNGNSTIRLMVARIERSHSGTEQSRTESSALLPKPDKPHVPPPGAGQPAVKAVTPKYPLLDAARLAELMKR